MALINCSECGNKQSRNAKICPNCGNPNTAVAIKQGFATLVSLVGLIWIICSVYLIYTNWIILVDCYIGKPKIGLAVLSVLVPLLQIFGQSNAPIISSCTQLSDENLITISRIAIGTFGLIFLLSVCLFSENDETDKKN